MPSETSLHKSINDSEISRLVLQGKLWRAKEILQGRVGSMPYSPDLYQDYGIVLFVMGDLIEAGKYLYLSGKRSSVYEEAVTLYLEKHGKHGWQNLAATFPQRVRAVPLEKLPKNLRSDLEKINYRPKKQDLPQVEEQTLKTWIGDKLACVGCAFFAIFVFVVFASITEVVRRLIFG
jgi:hypothetical protein